MKKPSQISSAVIKRLPRYRRFLRDLLREGVDRVSSSRLSEITGYTASQIRQDFNNFGGFGQQGYGYNVEDLYDGITAILGLDTERHMVIVGAGNLGRALAGFPWGKRDNFMVDGIFDNSPGVIGSKVGEYTVGSLPDLKKYLEVNNPDVGVIATNGHGAQEACDILVEGGVKGIWDFAPVDLELPDSIPLQYVHLNDSLHELTYRITETEHGHP
ncbi:MAG: redox-sensing transcriptional repressor Rex [Clostridiales Family XIII bacterium]|jgi:redox-sensing transcriptional repressor|nr:redox-sensing transcriptional repressor Rex [Clostridiales Family XIII bacterium]